MAAKARTLVVGTHNRKKRAEILELLDLPGLDIKILDDFPGAPEVDETGDTFLANATKKAVELALTLDHWVLGEDSGLVVDVLGGAPGVYSARFAGLPRDDERNNDLLLARLEGIAEAARTAHYVCTAVVADPSGAVRASAEGRCFGRIGFERRGKGGFGYDPLFIVPERNQSFGELPAEYKQRHSHRANAMRLLRPQLARLIDSGEWR